MAEVRSRIARAVDSPALRIYVVWVPVMRGDDRAAAIQAASRLEDPRAVHYWDEGGELARAMGAALGLRAQPGEAPFAWDVFLLYGPGAGWRDPAPPPGFWMHQLMGAAPPGTPFFDGDLMRARIEAALAGRAAGATENRRRH